MSIEILTNKDKTELLSKVQNNRSVRDSGKRTVPMMISFVDDDCKSAAYGDLYLNLIKKYHIPYTFACPPGNIGDSGYMSETQLKDVYANGVKISCHHYRQYNMDDSELLPTYDTYDQDLSLCDELFKSWGINDVISVSYPQGKYIDDYIGAAKDHYSMGFTVDQGINEQPYESFYMKRCEVFPESGDGSIDAAIERVNELMETGGWLIFMTHAWYPTFTTGALKDLIDYIQTNQIPIVTVNEAIHRTGNIIDIGKFKKPVTDLVDPFFIVDANGNAWTNSLKIFETAAYEYVTQSVSYNPNCYLTTSGTIMEHDDNNRTVSVLIPVKAGEVYKLTCSAIYAHALYAVGTLKEGSTRNLDVFEGMTKAPATNTADGIEGHTILIDHEITIPQDGYMYVSCNRTIQPNGFVIKKRV